MIDPDTLLAGAYACLALTLTLALLFLALYRRGRR